LIPTQVDINGLCESEKGNKQDQDCCKCRQRKPSHHHEKLEEHLKSASHVSEKTEESSDVKIKLGVNKEHQRPKGMVDSTDFIGNFIGPIGKWQLRTILLIYLCKIPSSWFMSCVSVFLVWLIDIVTNKI